VIGRELDTWKHLSEAGNHALEAIHRRMVEYRAGLALPPAEAKKETERIM
jgi:hypothetical protein